MNLRRLLSLTAVAGIAAGLMCLGPRPAAAEEDIGTETVHDGQTGSVTYHTYEYPSTKNSFSFSPNSYVSFDLVNGKWFELEHFRVNYEEHTSPGLAQVFPEGPYPFPYALRYDAMTKVSFYTPDLKLLHSYSIVRPGHKYSIPKDGNDYERVICRLEYGTDDKVDNASYKMRVWDEVDPVQSEPLNPGSDPYYTYPVRL
jgi:hypothetical protein